MIKKEDYISLLTLKHNKSAFNRKNSCLLQYLMYL
jgi:hypothetical protein